MFYPFCDKIKPYSKDILESFQMETFMASFLECAYMEKEVWDFGTFRMRLAESLEDLSDCEELCSNNEKSIQYLEANHVVFYESYKENLNKIDRIRIPSENLLGFMNTYPELKNYFLNKV